MDGHLVSEHCLEVCQPCVAQHGGSDSRNWEMQMVFVTVLKPRGHHHILSYQGVEIIPTIVDIPKPNIVPQTHFIKLNSHVALVRELAFAS